MDGWRKLEETAKVCLITSYNFPKFSACRQCKVIMLNAEGKLLPWFNWDLYNKVQVLRMRVVWLGWLLTPKFTPVPGNLLGIVGQDPSDSKSNRLQVDTFRFWCFHSFEVCSTDSSKMIGNPLKFRTPTSSFSNSTGSSLSKRRFPLSPGSHTCIHLWTSAACAQLVTIHSKRKDSRRWSKQGNALAIVWKSRFEWYVVTWRSKTGHCKRQVFEREWATCSEYAIHSCFSSQCD